ncbi:MFS transporter, OFA family, oxalate/formate antiporter [Desulfocicer vacuolatum DSM 3385]|uniref:MFS transporter, OFA family, oxalate/formate antiporter n=1 Tax=Desulfocicer vacuolatum DSM 3385 TaxID=1121400 RepID=A0A1W2B8N3_9BACT|nr:OFA family MFS transporter [Desulfocicer vacuolatum]SMC69289.1 MFS transporter, OFA family, oxalate/formate antiporter [Desulfocicer vacuolatum DSM 3385]
MSTQTIEKVPTQAWITTFSGTAINLCLGILYAWSIWKSALVNVDKAGQAMTGINEGWVYLTNAQAATPFSLCVIIFALLMIPGGRIQDKISPKFGATVGGLLLAAGCIIAGMMKSYTGLIIGFGILGGAGMGIGYAAPTPAALKWFGPEKRGLIAGLVVGGYGGAALYIGWLGQKLIDAYGVTGSFVALGTFFAVIVVIAGQMLKAPPEGYVPPSAASSVGTTQATEKTHNWEAGDMMKTWQFYALVFMFILTTQSGLLIISSAKGLMMKTAKDMPFFAANAWILVSFGGLVNASGRVGTGFYSDKIGRLNAYCLNCGVSALCLFVLPYVISTANLFLLFVVVGVAYWQYGGGLSLMPSFTADFFGAKNLGFNYGLVFIGWGLGFFMARVGGVIQDVTGSLDLAFYISGGLLVAGVILAKLTTKPQYTG